MYKDEIKTLQSENRNYRTYLIKEYIALYFGLLLHIRNSRDIRQSLTDFLRQYLSEANYKSQILKTIKNYFSNQERVTECEDILFDLEEWFRKTFHYNESVLSGFEDAIVTGEPHRATYLSKEFECIDSSYKKYALEKLRTAKEKH